ncbi:MAG: class I SAM-dependent methyltransferase [Spirulina sp. SIO3F2]|nr:class I SAM-dependent methyltransferase [Spirulina sp. SIO3F2]
MTTIKDWIWNEIQQIGKDYDSIEEVSVYDESHAKFRDVVSESQDILSQLHVDAGKTLLDIGCGTGAFAREAVKLGLHVTAVDVSEKMLDYATAKSSQDNVKPQYIKGGFLTIPIRGQTFDYITTSFSFHHLPDFYKFIALKRLNTLLSDNGKLFIQDVVIAEENFEENINQLIEHQTALGGEFLRDDAIGHFREEFSTLDWILEQMLDRAGFKVINQSSEGGLIAKYICLKMPLTL